MAGDGMDRRNFKEDDTKKAFTAARRSGYHLNTSLLSLPILLLFLLLLFLLFLFCYDIIVILFIISIIIIF